MPVDQKRIKVPENTISYNYFTNSHVLSTEKCNNIVKSDGTRKDGRTVNEQRKIYLKADVVSQAKGSAYIEVGKTKVIVSVFDPREIPNKVDYSLNGELYCEFKYATFSCPRRRTHQQDSEEKQNSIIMKQALESVVCRHEFPNFQVDIYALVLENDGSAVSAAITCAGLALSHAGVPMYDLITSITLSVQNTTKLLDPTLLEEELCSVAIKNEEQKYNNHGIIILSILSTHQQVSKFYQFGNIDLQQLQESIDVLIEANKQVVPLVKKCLVKYIEKKSRTEELQ